MVSELLRSKNHCLNCIRPGHFVKKFKSLHCCKVCQKPHHTLLHVDSKGDPTAKPSEPAASIPVTPANAAMTLPITSNVLLMTCQITVETPHGETRARALLDTGSSASFVSERLAQLLKLSRFSQNAKICSIAGLSHGGGKHFSHSIYCIRYSFTVKTVVCIAH